MSKKYINEIGLAYLWGKCVDLFAQKNALNSKADLVDGKIPVSQLPESSSGQDSFLVEADLNPTANFSVTNPTKDYETIANALSQKKDVKLLLNVNLSEDYYMAIIGEVETFYPTYGVIEFGAIINISLDDNMGEQVYHLKITFSSNGSIKTEYKVLSGESNNDSGGQSAVSPTVEITQIDDGHRITITDVNGTESFDVMNGKNGNNGTPATHQWDGTVLTITSASGTTSADLKGDAFVYEDFTDAQLEALKGKAFTYEDFTPEQLEALKGKDGNDYVLTDADKSNIADVVLSKLPVWNGGSY